MNFIAILVAALVPTVIGFLWYNPMLFGKVWQKATGLTEEDMKGANMPVMMILGLVFAFMLAFFLQLIVIHQMSVGSALFNVMEKGDEAAKAAGKAIIDQFSEGGIYANEHRTFGHGMLHGVMAGIFFVLPIFATNAMYERKPWKLTWINVGYWTLTLGVMGGIICAWP